MGLYWYDHEEKTGSPSKKVRKVVTDVSSTYRGFRNQALYILHRITNDPNAEEYVYRPEQDEDLAVFDLSGNLVEVVQVKDFSSDLAISHLKPTSKEGFFSRMNARRKAHPGCTTKIASFGPLGTELRAAIAGEAKHRHSVIKKLQNDKNSIPKGDVEDMLNSLQCNVLHPSSIQLKDEIREWLKGTVAAGSVEHALELMMYWVWESSEFKRTISRKTLAELIQRIGDFLSELRDHSSEWNVSFEDLVPKNISESEANMLKDEYRKGVQARWEHILVGADVVRESPLMRIREAFSKRPAVILHGASGQGKSSIGWRYLHDFCTSGLRFHVRLVEGREHALRIAHAMASHIQRLQMKAVAFLDVSPSDFGWSDLVRELTKNGFQVLVAVREEDFNRAAISANAFDFVDIPLDPISQREGRAIFDSIRATASPNILDFEDAWSRFSSSDSGPLMEFTYLVTEGKSLASCIGIQIARLQNEAANKSTGVTVSHLELLALASVANETGARVNLQLLCKESNIDLIVAPLTLLEDEYLLKVRTDSSRSYVTGVHAIRSHFIVKSLFRDSPGLWARYATRVMKCIPDEDIEVFLLTAFSRYPEATAEIQRELASSEIRSWVRAGGIAKSLIWEGVNQYEQTNREALVRAIEEFGTGWRVVCDVYLGTGEELLPRIRTLMSNNRSEPLSEFPLTPKAEVYRCFGEWAESVCEVPYPTTSRDWEHAGYAAFWISHIGSHCRLRSVLESLIPPRIPAGIGIDQWAAFVDGRKRLEDTASSQWMDAIRQEVLQFFCEQTKTVHVSDNNGELQLYYLARECGYTNLNEESVRRIHLIRKLLPPREVYHTKAIGMQLHVGIAGYDPSVKAIPASNLHDEHAVTVNSLFASLVEYRHCRSSSWKEYIEAVLRFRRSAIECLRKTYRAWEALLAEKQLRNATFAKIPITDARKVVDLSKIPLFPRTAVDEWGFVDEGGTQNKDQKPRSDQGGANEGQASIDRHDASIQKRSSPNDLRSSLLRYSEWKSVFLRFNTGVTNFFNFFIDASNAFQRVRLGEDVTESEENTARLSVINFANAWKEVLPMQREFRKLFAGIVDSITLDVLESHEQSTFRHLWPIAFAMKYNRSVQTTNAGQAMEAVIDNRKRQFISHVREEIVESLGIDATVEIQDRPWIIDSIPHLCVVCNHCKAARIDIRTKDAVEAIWRASQFVQWRSCEWQPFVIEWPKIALVNLVRGKALAQAAVLLSTMVIFSTEDVFEAKTHHIASLPVNELEFSSLGFEIYNNSLVNKVAICQANVFEFVQVSSEFIDISILIESEPDAVEGLTQEFLRTVSDYGTTALRSLADFVNHADETQDAELEMLSSRMQEACVPLLMGASFEQTNIHFTLEGFHEWSNGLPERVLVFKNVVEEIIDRCLDVQS